VENLFWPPSESYSQALSASSPTTHPYFPACIAPGTCYALAALVQSLLQRFGRRFSPRGGLAICLALMVAYTAIAAVVHAAHHRAECRASHGQDHPCFLYGFATGHAGAIPAPPPAILRPETPLVAVVASRPAPARGVDYRLSPSRAPPRG